MSYCIRCFSSPFLSPPSPLSRNPSVLFPRNFSRAKENRAILGEARRCESEPAWKIYRRTRGEHRGSQTRDLAINPAEKRKMVHSPLAVTRPFILPSLFLSLSLFLSRHFAHHVLVEKRRIDESHEPGELFHSRWIINERFPRSGGLPWRILPLINNLPVFDDAGLPTARWLGDFLAHLSATFRTCPEWNCGHTCASFVMEGKEERRRGIIRTRVHFSVGCLWGLDQFSRTKLDSVYPMKPRACYHMEYNKVML